MPSMEDLIAAAVLGNAGAATGDDDGGFWSTAWDQISGIPGNLWDLVNQIGGEMEDSDDFGYGAFTEARGAMGQGMVDDTVNFVTDPAGYIRENPGYALLSALGAVGPAARIAGRYADDVGDVGRRLLLEERGGNLPNSDTPTPWIGTVDQDPSGSMYAHWEGADLSNEAYRYHVTPADNLEAIRGGGLGQSGSPVFWSDEIIPGQVPSRNLRDPMVLRIRRGGVLEGGPVDTPLPIETTTGRVPASSLDVLGADRRWHPLVDDARGGLDDAAEEAAQADFAMTLEGLADEIVPEGTVVGSLDVEEIARNNARRLVAESEAEYNKLFQPGGITDNQGRLTPKGQMLQKLFMRARTREAGPATGPPGSSLGRNPDVLNPGAGQFYEGVNRATDESRRLMEDYPGKGGGRTTSKAMIDDETGKTVGGRRGGAIEQSVEVSNARGRARDPNWTIPPVWSESKLHLGGFRNKKGSFKEQGRFNPSKKGPTDPTPERPFDYESTYMSADDAEDALRIEAGPYDYAGGRLPVGRKKPRFPGDESPVIERQGRTAQDFENQMAAPWVHPDVQEFQAPPINPGASTMERLLAELVDEGIPEGEGRFVPGKYRPVEEPPPPTPSRMPQSTLEKAGVGRKAKRVGRTVEELEEWYRQQREEALRARRERY